MFFFSFFLKKNKKNHKNSTYNVIKETTNLMMFPINLLNSNWVFEQTLIFVLDSKTLLLDNRNFEWEKKQKKKKK